jgi:hypothetical protein
VRLVAPAKCLKTPLAICADFRKVFEPERKRA